MRKDEIRICEIETARITANNKEYDRAVLYQVIRDTLEQYRKALEGLGSL